ncbi:MAG: GGDEF domain-containing protein [Chloroflexota bacterium]|nr:GGDEF domain-containing protein [Chloroflexota bacterium]
MVQAGIALSAALAIRGPLRRHPDSVAAAFLVSVPIVPLASIAVQPDLTLLVGASLALIPSAVALLIPWRRSMYALWAVGFAAIVVLATTFLQQVAALPAALGLQLIAVVFIGIAFGILGQRIRRRQDILDGEYQDMQRELAQQSRIQAAALKVLNEELALTARADALTGAGNRLRLDEDMAALSDRLRRYGQALSLILLDIDHFKEYNDRYGHVAGDDALRRVVSSLRDGLRPGDLIYRYGGEELLVVLPEQGPDGAVKAAERLRSLLQDAGIPHEANPPWGVLTLSGGVVAVPAGTGSNWNEWVERADRALYLAKRTGRNRIQLATSEALVTT